MGLGQQYRAEVVSLKDDEAKRRDEVARGEKARAILDNPMVVEAFATLIRRAFDDWHNSAPGDAAKRELVYDELQAIKRFKAEFETVLTTGQLAARQLPSLERQRAFRETRLGKTA